jgi:hypothetical protein
MTAMMLACHGVQPHDPARSQMKGAYAEWGVLKIAKTFSDWLFFHPISKNSFGLFPDAGGAFYFPEGEKTPVEAGMPTDNAPHAQAVLADRTQAS